MTMLQTLTMPRLGETMDEGIILGWLVAPGERFRRGQPILELETDKTVVEFPALGDGQFDEALAGPGDRIAVGAPIARVTVTDAADWADSRAEQAPAKAANILRMPRLGETMEEGVIVQWLLPEGAPYARGAALLEIETDKTVAEVPALHEGRLLRILATPGQKIAVGDPLAEVEGEVEQATPEKPAAAPITGAPAPLPPSPASARLRATPLARRIARSRGIALETVRGTGRRGRIERSDVESATPGASQIEGTGGRLHLLIHGFAGDSTAWAHLGAALRRAGHRTVTPDLPGHGANDAPAPDLAALTTAALQLAQSLPGPLVLVGHSMGAVIAADLAASLGAKVAALVLITPAGCGPQIGAEFIHGMAQATAPDELSHLLRLLGPRGAATSDTMLSQMAAQLAQGRLRALAPALASPEGRQRIDLLRRLQGLPASLPVSALFGTADQIVAATDALNLPPRVSVHFLPTGHMPQWDAVPEVVDLILKGGTHG